jgi:extracellular factor (EF) 3-hydroxypalmitic acid methyl ester biosynthesis protein
MKVQEKYFDSVIQTSMMEKIRPLLDTLNDNNARHMVENFWSKASRYFGVLFGINKAIEEGILYEEPASDIVIQETEAILQEGKILEESLNNTEIIKKVKIIFRECGIPVGLKSEIVKHAFLKPRGYAGDYGIIEIVCDNKIISKGFGYCGDKVFINNDYAKAVRSRKDKMKNMLVNFINNEKKLNLDILNIACGSCREIKEMFEENNFDTTNKISFTLVDQDQKALDFSKNVLKISPPNIEYHYLRNSIYDYINNPESFREQLNNIDLIYTIGLADYLPENVLKALTAFLFSLLKPDGKLIIAHKDSKSYSPLAPDWWCDWTFHLRDESEMIELVNTSGIEHFTLRIERETNTNIIFFIIIENKIKT